MSLIDDLRAVAHLIPPSHVPTTSEALGVVGALLTRLEVGEQKFAEAAERGQEGIDELFRPPATESAPVAAAPGSEVPSVPAAAAAPSDDETSEAADRASLEADNARLRSELAAALGNAQRTTVTPLPANDSAPAPAAPASSPAEPIGSPASSAPPVPSTTPPAL